MFYNFLPNESGRTKFYNYIAENFKEVDAGALGKSILGSDIHYYKIGCGIDAVISVGAHHGMEYITAEALYNVIGILLENLTRHATSYGVNIAFLLQKFTFWFIPCLNADGVDMVLSGVRNNPLRERQIRMNCGEDFSDWQANARGVDLNHNYAFRFFEYKKIEADENILPGKTRFSGEYPESEPEVRALANLVRVIRPQLILSFHSQGEEVFFRPRNKRKVLRIAQSAAELLGYSLSRPEGLADYGGLSDYAGEILGIPSLTVEVGKGKNPLPESQLSAIAERLYKLHVLLPTKL